MSITNEQFIEHISKMSVLDLANLVKELETKFGVSAAPVAVAGGAGPAVAAEEKTEFTVVLTDAGAQKINVIKANKMRIFFLISRFVFQVVV